MTPRQVRQPGPPAAARADCVPAGAVAIEATLPAGERLLDSLANLLATSQVESACLTLSGGAFGPFGYVIPALSADGARAAFYSEAVRPAGETRLELATVTVGRRDGRPWFHCHAVWDEADGRRGCGHVLPDETLIAAPIQVRGAGIVGACFQVVADEETGFSLFKPRATGTPPPPGARPALAVRLAPNQDLTEALERAGREAGFLRALVAGGVASVIGARFADAPAIDGFATELLVRRGLVRCAPEAGAATELDIVIVDLHGAIGAGRLLAGDNPVLMTFEGLLEQV